MQGRCAGEKQDGSPCNGVPWNGSPLCFHHAPEAAGLRAKGRKLGGSARSNAARARKEIADKAMTAEELQGILGMTITAVLAGTKPPGIGSAIAALARASIEIRKVTEVEQRLTELEVALDLRDRRGA